MAPSSIERSMFCSREASEAGSGRSTKNKAPRTIRTRTTTTSVLFKGPPYKGLAGAALGTGRFFRVVRVVPAFLGVTGPGPFASPELVARFGPVKEVLRQLRYDVFVRRGAPRAVPRALVAFDAVAKRRTGPFRLVLPVPGGVTPPPLAEDVGPLFA